MGIVQNYQGLVATRFCLGIAEVKTHIEMCVQLMTELVWIFPRRNVFVNDLVQAI